MVQGRYCAKLAVAGTQCAPCNIDHRERYGSRRRRRKDDDSRIRGRAEYRGLAGTENHGASPKRKRLTCRCGNLSGRRDADVATWPHISEIYVVHQRAANRRAQRAADYRYKAGTDGTEVADLQHSARKVRTSRIAA